MRINNNLMALNTHRQLGINIDSGAKAIEKLSSGFRINRAGDDAAGLAISEKMRAQIRGLGQASRNAQDSISLVQTAEGAMNEAQAILQRMRELAVQSANDTNVDADREALQNEINQLATELTRIANDTEFNERTLLNGGLQDANIGELTFHIGANAGQSVRLGIGAIDAQTLGVAGVSREGKIAAGAVNVTGATISSGIVGAAIVDEASIDVSATANAATAASFVAENASGANGTNDLSNITGASLTITIDGVAFTADNAEIEDWGVLANTGALATVIGAIENADGDALSTVVAVTDDGGNLSIEHLLAGAGHTIEVSVVAGTAGGGTNEVNLAAILNLGTPVETAGTDVSYTVTFTDGTATETVTSLSGTETSIAGTGAFEGLTLTTDGAFDENIAATIAISETTGSAATFLNGELVDKAEAKAGLDITSQASADAAITLINKAITQVSDERAKLGAVQNRLEHTIKNLDTSAENLQASESRIRDVDMASEMMEFTKNNILSQAAQAMLAQANQAPQGVLQLLR